MVLPECNLLPHGLLPLYIFEPRYRDMLADALARDRLFCVGMRRTAGAESRDAAPEVFDHSTIGLIRASVCHNDGTSHLILQGLRRVRFLDWIDDHPYRVARVEPLKSTTANQLQSEALAAKLLELARRLVEHGVEISDQLQKYLGSLDDPETIADIIAYNFIPNPYERQFLLETQEVCDRLRYVVEKLSESLAKMGTSS